jgi:transcriptional regulator of arginine metabolism
MADTAARRRLIRSLLAEDEITSQADLLERLAGAGHPVTQATVSRDLAALGAVKVEASGSARYLLSDRAGRPPPGAGRALAGYTLAIAPSANLVVVKTVPGAAHLVGAAIDGADLAGILGTVAGDDTVLVVADEKVGGRRVAAALERLGE